MSKISSISQLDEESTERLREAERLFERCSYDAAFEITSVLVPEFPDLAPLVALHGIIMAHIEKEKDQAEATIKRSLMLDMGSPMPWFSMGLLRMHLREYDAAIKCLKCAISKGSSPGAMTELANAYSVTYRFSDLVDIRRKIYNMNPHDKNSIINLVIALELNENNDEVVELCEFLLTPGHTWALMGDAELEVRIHYFEALYATRKYVAGLAALQSYIKTKPSLSDDIRLNELLGLFAIRCQKHSLAKEVYLHLITSMPRNSDYYFGLLISTPKYASLLKPFGSKDIPFEYYPRCLNPNNKMSHAFTRPLVGYYSPELGVIRKVNGETGEEYYQQAPLNLYMFLLEFYNNLEEPSAVTACDKAIDTEVELDISKLRGAAVELYREFLRLADQFTDARETLVSFCLPFIKERALAKHIIREMFEASVNKGSFCLIDQLSSMAVGKFAPLITEILDEWIMRRTGSKQSDVLYMAKAQLCHILNNDVDEALKILDDIVAVRDHIKADFDSMKAKYQYLSQHISNTEYGSILKNIYSSSFKDKELYYSAMRILAENSMYTEILELAREFYSCTENLKDRIYDSEDFHLEVAFVKGFMKAGQYQNAFDMLSSILRRVDKIRTDPLDFHFYACRNVRLTAIIDYWRFTHKFYCRTPISEAVVIYLNLICDFIEKIKIADNGENYLITTDETPLHLRKVIYTISPECRFDVCSMSNEKLRSLIKEVVVRILDLNDSQIDYRVAQSVLRCLKILEMEDSRIRKLIKRNLPTEDTSR